MTSGDPAKLPVVSNDDKQYVPTSSRLTADHRAFIKSAVVEIERRGRTGFTVSDLLREAALEKAAEVLGVTFSDWLDRTATEPAA